MSPLLVDFREGRVSAPAIGLQHIEALLLNHTTRSHINASCKVTHLLLVLLLSHLLWNFKILAI
ncbi:hypothetical protein OUZ56_029570 [Daphnia magna]|uniref:Uncharacterized protein n=1 Tax=Daphnia magna TaxID=35525 RepID=A0ABR0B772_9CRUS|nr:hypothetical protein OUZ56_029570 [Daphnia magna]